MSGLPKADDQARYSITIIGEGELRCRNIEVETLGRREVDEQVEPRGLLNRHLGGLSGLEGRPVKMPTWRYASVRLARS
jgi:hypothetical protein